MRRTGGSIAAVALLVVGVVILVVGRVNTPNSTAGVRDLGNNVAVLPAGEVFVLTHKVGKERKVYKITYDGKDTVYFRCESTFCTDVGPVTLCGVGCTVDTYKGLWDKFQTTLQSDGTVMIKWPWGWKYRPYRS